MSAGDLLTAVGGILGALAAIYVATRTPSIERLRARLQREGAEHELRFARLQERRFDVVSEVYRNLVRAERAFSSWIHPFQPAGAKLPEEKGSEAIQLAIVFVEHFEETRIWFDADLCAEIQKVVAGLNDAYIRFTTYPPNDPSARALRLDEWQQAWKSVSEEVPRTRNQIEERFRVLLGVTPNEELDAAPS